MIFRRIQYNFLAGTQMCASSYAKFLNLDVPRRINEDEDRAQDSAVTYKTAVVLSEAKPLATDILFNIAIFLSKSLPNLYRLSLRTSSNGRETLPGLSGYCDA